MFWQSITQLTHDLRTYAWGVITDHPCWRDTQIGIVWPLQIRKLNAPYGCIFQIGFYQPKLQVLNAYEMELDYLMRGGQSNVNG